MSWMIDFNRINDARKVLQWSLIGPALWESNYKSQIQLYFILALILVEIVTFIMVCFKDKIKAIENNKVLLSASKSFFIILNYIEIFCLTAGFLPIVSIF